MPDQERNQEDEADDGGQPNAKQGQRGRLRHRNLFDARGVELAQFAMAHRKRLCIVYRITGFTWADVVDIAVLDY